MKKRIYFISLFSSFLLFLGILLFFPIYTTKHLIFYYAIHPFDICIEKSYLWKLIKLLFFIFYILSSIIISNSIYSIKLNKAANGKKNKKVTNSIINSDLNLLIGYNKENSPIYLCEKSLYQNILITGTIGSGKTSCAMFPFTKQLIEYKSTIITEKIGMLILDVKGNFHSQVSYYAKKNNRLDDLIIIEPGGKYKYNPLNKPNLKSSVLANRLKNILLLFSPNNSESYWLDKVEQVLTECIKLCRLYNDNYVTFEEIHNLVNNPNYYTKKIEILRNLFLTQQLTQEDMYNLSSALNFFENEYLQLDPRTLSILKSEVTRITNCFLSDYEIYKTFNPSKNEENFYGFKDLITSGKIVVLNMNIAEYKNISKLIAAYLKFDFQTEVLSRLSHQESIRKVAFISDEYHEYVTSNDADFFAQCREAKCINILATQSYSSLLNTLKDEKTFKVLVQNLVNKLWFRTDDYFTIENAQKQIGKEEKLKTSTTISESAKETHYNFFTNTLNSKLSNISESINKYSQFEFIYDTSFFTQKLETFSCLSFLSNGEQIITPQKITLIPHFISEER